MIIGKGITFDSGGLNLKPGDSMRTMYTDMAGGAAALGAMQAVAARRLPVRLTVLVPAAENSLSGSAMRPSDVIRHYGGRTTEVQNTDAEGRLVLADALAYAVARLRPTALVDLATLTGAMKVALGLRTGGLLSTDDDLAAALLAAGAAAGEPLWRMPLVEEHVALLDSAVADAQNAPGNPAGSPLRCSFALSSAPCHGRISTLPGRLGPPPMPASCPRARPGSAPGCVRWVRAGPASSEHPEGARGPCARRGRVGAGDTAA